MYKTLSVILILICISAGCITQNPGQTGPVDDQGINQETYPETDNQTGQEIYLITREAGSSIFDGSVAFDELTGISDPGIETGYSLGYATISAGNATSPHRLADRTEFISVVAGEALIKCDNTEVNAKKGDSVLLPKGVLQSATALGDEELRYISVVDPVFTPEAEIKGESLFALNMTTDEVPVIIPDPKKGIEWDIGSDMMIYSVLNPVLMPEMNAPVEYSVAYAELLPGGFAQDNYLNGSSELICVIEGEILVYTPNGNSISVTAGNAAYIPPNQIKGYRNVADSVSTIMSFVDPAWTPENTFTPEN